jgi:hypothetical protein
MTRGVRRGVSGLLTDSLALTLHKEGKRPHRAAGHGMPGCVPGQGVFNRTGIGWMVLK